MHKLFCDSISTFNRHFRAFESQTKSLSKTRSLLELNVPICIIYLNQNIFSDGYAASFIHVRVKD